MAKDKASQRPTAVLDSAKPKEPPKEPIMTCPTTGAALEIKFSPRTNTYMVVGPFWNSKLYKSKLELEHDISHRNGVAPGFSRTAPKITVRELEEPEPNPNADLVVADVMGDK